MDFASARNSLVHSTAAEAIRRLVRGLTRQYESFKWAGENETLWETLANLRWTHLVQTRTITEGFHWTIAFEKEARNRTSRSRSLGRASSTPRTQLEPAHSSQHRQPANQSSHWLH